MTPRVHKEYAVEVLEVEDGEAHFRTDHAACDDNLYFNFGLIGELWTLKDTAQFKGYVGRVEKCPQCNRHYRRYVPWALVVEARLR